MSKTQTHFLTTLALISVMWPSPAAAQSLAEEQAFRQAVTIADPSVVRIETVGGVDLVGNILTGTGPTTGVIVSEDGDIITSSFNFVSRPASILVTLADGRRFPADQVASDRSRMLTLLKIDATGLIPLSPADKHDLRVGQWALALGRTYDSAFPGMSVGILSALDRIWGRAVQTDAKVSPVNYGGPLIDLDGRGIGILVPLSPQGTDETAGVEWYDAGIGFAVPLADVYAVLDRLKAGEDLRPGLMGVTFPEMGILAGEARIDRIRPGSPADKAGMEVGDVIIAVNGQHVDRVPTLQHLVGPSYAGETLTLTIRRGDESRDVLVELVGQLVPYESGFLGILPRRSSRSGSTTGVGVRNVLPGSPAEQAGLNTNDLIIAVGGEPVADTAALRDRISRIEPGQTVQLTVTRNGAPTDHDITLSTVPASIPEQLAPEHIPTLPAPLNNADVKTGRFTSTLPGEDQPFWAYVPENYNSEWEYTLLVWLHPAADTMEAAVLGAWRSFCEDRGIIIVAPKAADISGWTPGETEFVSAVVQHMQSRYTIDPARIAVHGHAAGGLFAWQTAFKHRELFRGLMIASAPLNQPPPDTDPATPQRLLVVCGENDPLRPAIEESVEVLKQRKFPTGLLVTPGGEAYPEAAVRSMALWLDLLEGI